MKKLDDIKNIPLKSILRVYKKGYGYAILTVVATDNLFFATQGDETFTSFIKDGDKVEVYFWVEELASFEFTLEVIGKVNRYPWLIFFSNTTVIQKNNERKCLGAPTDLSIAFFMFSPLEHHKSFSSEKVVSHNGTVIWLEDREAIIRTDYAIQDEVFIKGHIKLEGIDTEIMGRISILNREKNIFNLLFIGVPDESRNRILDYIYTTYRE